MAIRAFVLLVVFVVTVPLALADAEELPTLAPLSVPTAWSDLETINLEPGSGETHHTCFKHAGCSTLFEDKKITSNIYYSWNNAAEDAGGYYGFFDMDSWNALGSSEQTWRWECKFPSCSLDKSSTGEYYTHAWEQVTVVNAPDYEAAKTGFSLVYKDA